MIGKTYTLEEMDKQVKINMRLLEKFKAQLWAEYGYTVENIMKMFDTLYEEQQEVMPLPWYEYCCGVSDTKKWSGDNGCKADRPSKEENTGGLCADQQLLRHRENQRRFSDHG